MASYSDINGLDYSPTYKNPLRRRSGDVLNRAPITQEILYTLTGATAGSTALVENKRVEHSTTELGGVRTIETEEKINRATTSADLSEMRAMILHSSRITLATDLAGNWLGKAA